MARHYCDLVQIAAPGTLRLAPPQDVAKELRRDYAAMSPLFMEEPPAFEELLARLEEIEARVNQGAQGA